MKRDPSLPPAYVNALLEGDRLVELGQWGEAKLELETARELIEDFCREEIERIGEILGQTYGKLIEASLAAGDELKAAGDMEAAKEQYLIALDLTTSPQQKDEIRVRMELDEDEEGASLDDTESALEALFEGVDDKPDSPEALYNLATELAIEGYVDQAVAYFERVIALTPEDPHPQYRMGNALADMERYEDAAKAYKKALELGYDLSEIEYRLGLLAKEQGDTTKALEHLHKCLETKADDLASLKAVAHIHEVEERFAESIKFYERVIDVDPEDAQCTFALGNLYEQIDDLEKARLYWAKTRELPDPEYQIYAEDKLAETAEAS